MRWRVLVVDERRSDEWDLIVGRYKQKASDEVAAVREVQEREFRGRDLTGLRFYAYK